MKAVTALARRKLECVSDLTIDRWLLGETPGSDEARRLEEHMKGCSGCASRIGALRGLYSTVVPPVGHEPPMRITTPPAASPGQTGAVQFLILRDGLLVGSEFFTPGTYVIGSDPRADLQLDGVAAMHARLYFRDGRVAVKAEGGVVLVGGFKIDSCEVRSIDEVWVGPYVLRTRIIRERWSDVHPAVTQLHAAEEGVTELTVVDPPVTSLPLPSGGEGRGEGSSFSELEQGKNALDSARAERSSAPLSPLHTRITAELWWGDTRQQATSFERPVTARDFPLWGFGVSDDFVLATPSSEGTFQVHAPGKGDDLTLRPGASQTFTAGTLRLTLRVDAVLAPLPRAKIDAWPVTILSAAMMVAFFTAMFLAPEPEEQAFAPKTVLRYVTLLPPTPKVVKPEDPRTSKSDSAPVKTPTRPHPPARPPPVAARPPALDRLAKLNEVLGGRAFKNSLDGLKKATPGKGQPLFANLGPPGGKTGFDIPTIDDGRIGAAGLKTGGLLTNKGYGKARIGGQVERPSGNKFSFRGGGPNTSIDKDALAKAIAEHLGEVSSCYERALIRNGGGGGRLLLEWTVSTSGRVESAKVKNSSLKDGTIASCVLSALKTWAFPKATGGSVVVSYPFVFQSSDYR